MLDRIDLQIEVPSITATVLRDAAVGESSAVVQRRATLAREIQIARQGKANALLTPREIEQHCKPDDQGDGLLRQAIARLDLSTRAYHRVLKVARTIADLAQAPALTSSHIAEAIGYRRGMDGRM